MSERDHKWVSLRELTDEEKAKLALELMEEPANLSVKDDVFRTLMEEADAQGIRGHDGWLDHVLEFLAVGTYVKIEYR